MHTADCTIVRKTSSHFQVSSCRSLSYALCGMLIGEKRREEKWNSEEQTGGAAKAPVTL
jgi:hypothetical protein